MTSAIIGLILLVLVLVLLGPLLLIWALNTLFVLGIPFTLSTYLAALILAGTVGGSKVSFK